MLKFHQLHGRFLRDRVELLDDAVAGMLALIARGASGDDEQRSGRGAALEGVDAFAAIREEPGNVSVKTIAARWSNSG
jgi:hypothetical protein